MKFTVPYLMENKVSIQCIQYKEAPKEIAKTTKNMGMIQWAKAQPTRWRHKKHSLLKPEPYQSKESAKIIEHFFFKVQLTHKNRLPKKRFFSSLLDCSSFSNDL